VWGKAPLRARGKAPKGKGKAPKGKGKAPPKQGEALQKDPAIREAGAVGSSHLRQEMRKDRPSIAACLSRA